MTAITDDSVSDPGVLLPPGPVVDVDRLLLALEAAVAARGITDKKALDEAVVAPTVMSRMRRGVAPGPETVIRLLAWLRLPADRFTTSTVTMRPRAAQAARRAARLNGPSSDGRHATTEPVGAALAAAGS